MPCTCFLVDENIYFSLISEGSQTGKIYGMTIIYEIDCQLRTVLSAIGRSVRVQFVQQNVTKKCTNNQYNYWFINDLNNIKPQKADACRNFDIKSLHACVPLKYKKNMVAEDVYSNENSSIFIKIKTVFKKIFETWSQNIFVFNGQMFKQLDWTSKDSLFTPF